VECRTNESLELGFELWSTTRTNCCIYTVYLLMMGYRYVRNMERSIVEINWG